MTSNLFDDNEIVRLKRDLPDENLTEGERGTVVMVYPQHLSPHLPQAYEVEFCDEDGVTLALVTLMESDLEPNYS